MKSNIFVEVPPREPVCIKIILKEKEKEDELAIQLLHEKKISSFHISHTTIYFANNDKVYCSEANELDLYTAFSEYASIKEQYIETYGKDILEITCLPIVSFSV